MRKHSEGEEEGHENSERWLLTYSDMITLLLALFIILYTMSNVDLNKFKLLAKNLGVAFNAEEIKGDTKGLENIDIDKINLDGTKSGSGNDTKDTQTKTETTVPETTEQTGTGTGTGTGNGTGGTMIDGLDEIYNELSNYVQKNDLDSSINIEKTDTYVKIRLKDKVLFYPDSARMIDTSKPILKKIRQALSNVYGKIDHITISGHTATVSNETATSSNFAWQLSSDRAVTVLNFLSDNGLPQSKLSIEGYSHFDPVAPNDTEENRAKNRRVEITISKQTKSETGTGSATKSSSAGSASAAASSTKK